MKTKFNLLLSTLGKVFLPEVCFFSGSNASDIFALHANLHLPTYRRP